MRSTSLPSTISPRVEADQAADVSRHQLVVAGEDLHLDAVTPQPRDRRSDPLEQVIGEGQESGERELALVGGAEARRPRDALRGHREHPEAALAQRAEGSSHRATADRVERTRRALGLVGGADREDALGCALGHEERAPLPRHHDREPAPLEVEGHLVRLREALRSRGGPLEDRGVERALDAGLELAVQPRQGERPIRGRAEWIERGVERHRPRRERAGLVAAEDVDAPEVLDRGEVLHDHLLARHPDGALREASRW